MQENALFPQHLIGLHIAPLLSSLPALGAEHHSSASTESSLTQSLSFSPHCHFDTKGMSSERLEEGAAMKHKTGIDGCVGLYM